MREEYYIKEGGLQPSSKGQPLSDGGHKVLMGGVPPRIFHLGTSDKYIFKGLQKEIPQILVRPPNIFC